MENLNQKTQIKAMLREEFEKLQEEDLLDLYGRLESKFGLTREQIQEAMNRSVD